MLAFLLVVVLRLLKYTFIAGMVAVYSEIGLGGEFVGNLVEAFRVVGAEIDWTALGESIIKELKNLGELIAAELASGDDIVAQCVSSSCDIKE